jgi:hypothetical protein
MKINHHFGSVHLTEQYVKSIDEKAVYDIVHYKRMLTFTEAGYRSMLE